MQGLTWLVDCQQFDGSWPLSCASAAGPLREAGAPDLTSDALSAIAAWARLWQAERAGRALPPEQAALIGRIRTAIARGLAWLTAQQREDGSFTAASFGNHYHINEQNPVYGTARVLAACAALDQLDTPLAERAAGWLSRAQHVGGGWGPPRTPLDYSDSHHDGSRSWRTNEALAKSCSVEETAWAISALLPLLKIDPDYGPRVVNGLDWLATAVETDLHRRPAVVGVWQRKFWYDERLYPLVFAADALSRAVRDLARPQSEVTLQV
jgi:squalene-hopene/tetraprenyl-beta-curcumene cyclase